MNFPKIVSLHVLRNESTSYKYMKQYNKLLKKVKTDIAVTLKHERETLNNSVVLKS